MMITILTPIFNRAYIVGQLYNSLCGQTNKDFEWLIIDDGSTDNIAKLVAEWQTNDNGFQIRFMQKENEGKHSCINIGTDLANGEYFFIVDSDDFLPADSVDTVARWIHEIEGANNIDLIGVAGLKCNYEKGGNIGKTFSANKAMGKSDGVDYVDCTSLEREKYGIYGDKAEVFKTDVIKRYKFPVFPGEKFLTENCIWYAIAADGYKLRWFNKAIYCCEYLEDGLTKNAGKIKCIKGEIYTTYIYNKFGKMSFRNRIAHYGALGGALRELNYPQEYMSYAKEKLGFWGRKTSLKFCFSIRKLYRMIAGKE